MSTNSCDPADFDRLRHLDAEAVRDSVTLVRRITPDDLTRPTPCSAWTLADLLAHMTAQHRGFAAAALGQGEDLTHWTPRPSAERPATEDAVAEYGEAAEEVIAAFAAIAAPDHPFALPEITAAGTFPAAQAITFHLVDYVAHGWDVARSLGLGYQPGPDLLRAALPIALAVPDGDARLAPGSPFGPGLDAVPGASELDRLLAALGRSPDWAVPQTRSVTC
ncbi:TIGR03086 family metal-binding protein [Streptomyces sp. NPDC058001]|uniref:TIGR03086 family metal-binding protein n=1 Tax=Streptomyces sp. NPDC058001 TaxID=3346300 RepID=UPI0036ED466F